MRITQQNDQVLTDSDGLINKLMVRLKSDINKSLTNKTTYDLSHRGFEYEKWGKCAQI